MRELLKNLKIRHALITIITVSLLTLTVTTIVLNNIMFTNVFEDNIEADLLPNQLAKVEAKIRYQLSTPLELSKAITQNKMLIDWSLAGEPATQEAQLIDFLSHMKKANDAFVVFWVSNVTKKYFNQSGLLKTVSQADDGWFFNFINSNKPFEVAFDFEEGSSELTAFVNYRVRAQGKDLAIAGLGYSVSQISEDILSNKIGETGYVFVTDQQGKVMIHPELSELKQRQLQQFDGFANVSSKLLTKNPNYVFDYVTKDGIDYYVASVGIPELEWKIIAMLPVAEPMAQINSALANTGIINLIMAFGFILLMVLIANRITKPIVDIGDRLLEMANHGGDLTQQLDDQRGDELGLLAKGFNAILLKVKEIMVDIKKTENVMATSFDNLRDMTQHVEQCVQEQRIESDSVAAATTEMNQSIQEVSDLALNTANKTETAEKQIESTNGQVDDTSKVMAQLHQSNQSTQEKIAELAAQTQTISSVVDTISSISEQTNLLALNAAIEAARAGEQGRGFAVVADEVRSLAARTQASTKEINDVIERLQHQAKETVESMSQNTELAGEGLEKTNIAKSALNEVVQEISQITDMNTQVATATNEQSNVISELSVNVTKIADMASQVSELSQQTNNIIEELDEQKVQLGNLVSQFKTS
ncbi:methyl-accepting chemotaxis protein [Thalassotalea fusca]